MKQNLKKKKETKSFYLFHEVVAASKKSMKKKGDLGGGGGGGGVGRMIWLFSSTFSEEILHCRPSFKLIILLNKIKFGVEAHHVLLE